MERRAQHRRRRAGGIDLALVSAASARRVRRSPSRALSCPSLPSLSLLVAMKMTVQACVLLSRPADAMPCGGRSDVLAMIVLMSVTTGGTRTGPRRRHSTAWLPRVPAAGRARPHLRQGVGHRQTHLRENVGVVVVEVPDQGSQTWASHSISSSLHNARVAPPR